MTVCTFDKINIPKSNMASNSYVTSTSTGITNGTSSVPYTTTTIGDQFIYDPQPNTIRSPAKPRNKNANIKKLAKKTFNIEVCQNGYIITTLESVFTFTEYTEMIEWIRKHTQNEENQNKETPNANKK